MLYFAYGANLNKSVMQQRCADSKPLYTAVLPNYKLVFIGWSRQWRGGTASIKASRGDRVRGAIYEITDICLQKLDKVEGYPQTHNRLKVIVFGEDDEAREAVTYIHTGHAEENKPSAEYLAIIQQGLRDWRLF